MKYRISPVLLFLLILSLIGTAVLSPAKAALWDKRYVVKHDQGQDILCDPYVVQQGDWIFKIFRQKGEISEQDYPAFLDIFKNINPQVGDIDQIYPGNLILIPLKIITQGTLPLYSSELVVIPFASISDSPIETVEIRKGDTVSKLIFQFFGSANTKEYEEALRRFQKLNPQVTDLDQIMVGQKIRMPAPPALEAGERKTYTPIPVNTSSMAAISERNATEQAMTDVPKTSASVEDGNTDPISEQASVPKIATILKQIALLLDAELYDQGSYHFPVMGQEDLRLDLGLFPVVRLKNNARIIFLRPFSKALSDISVIKSQWKPVFFVRIPASPVSIYYLLDKVFAMINRNQPRKIIRFKDGGVTADIHAKWILKMENISGKPDRHICLEPVDQKAAPFPETIFRYLTKRHITYWGVKPDGHINGTSSQGYYNIGMTGQPPISTESPKRFLHQLASALGWGFQENISVSFPYAGIQVNAVSNMLSIDTERACLVDFGSFAGNSITAIETTGLKVISLKGPFDALKYMRQILKKLSFGYTENPTIIVENNRDGQGVSFTYPGLMIPQTDGQALITSAAISDEMHNFLESRGTQVVRIIL